MKNELRRTASIATASIVVIVLLLVTMPISIMAQSQSGSVVVDVFTQQQPYSGRGFNMPSDSFAPQDVVILYAQVTYGGQPMVNTPVGFVVKMPDGSTFSLSGMSNMSGIASVSFRIPTPGLNSSADAIFGIWTVTGSVSFGGKVYQDVLTFKVDWIVKLLSVRTVDQNLTNQNHFGKGGDMGVVITLRSIAMTLKNATIQIVVYDDVKVPVNTTETQDFIVPPNEQVVTIYIKATLPIGSFVGSRSPSVNVSAITSLNGGYPYCPPVSTGFSITTEDPIKIDYPDAAVVVVLPSAGTIEADQSLTLETIVRSEGTLAETFSVNTYFDQMLLGTNQVTALPAYKAAIFFFSINSSLLTVGDHTISAFIPYLPVEVNLTDNYFSSQIVVTPIPQVVRDIGIASIILSTNSIFVGGVVNIHVMVMNNGNSTESFSVSTYYNSSLIGTEQVSLLVPGAEQDLLFSWDTSLVSPGTYQISASAPLTGDSSPGDNTYLDGFVKVMKQLPPFVHDVNITSVTLSTHSVYIGGIVGIYVTVKNNGTYAESFGVSTYYNSTFIGTAQVSSLAPGGEQNLVFSWDTSSVTAGSYRINASAPLAGDFSPGDNTYLDGLINVMTPVPPIDVAITDANLSKPSPAKFFIGQTVKINAVAANLGTVPEVFNVTAYENGTEIAPPTQVSLGPNANTSLTFSWDTSGAIKGTYNITVSASHVAGETNFLNNDRVAGQVNLTQSSPFPLGPGDLFLILLILILLALSAFLILLVLRRRKSEEPDVMEQLVFSTW
jgi:hypothetical protein